MRYNNGSYLLDNKRSGGRFFVWAVIAMIASALLVGFAFLVAELFLEYAPDPLPENSYSWNVTFTTSELIEGEDLFVLSGSDDGIHITERWEVANNSYLRFKLSYNLGENNGIFVLQDYFDDMLDRLTFNSTNVYKFVFLPDGFYYLCDMDNAPQTLQTLLGTGIGSISILNSSNVKIPENQNVLSEDNREISADIRFDFQTVNATEMVINENLNVYQNAHNHFLHSFAVSQNVLPYRIVDKEIVEYIGGVGSATINLPKTYTLGEITYNAETSAVELQVFEGSDIKIRGIGNSVFKDRSDLNFNMDLKNIRRIGDSAFQNSGLNTAQLKFFGNVRIGNEAFSGTNGIFSVNFSESTAIIGNNAFYNCDGILSVNFAGSDAVIGESAFENCDGVTSLNFNGSNALIGKNAFKDCVNLAGALNISDISGLNEYSFSNCKKITSIVFPASLTEIPAYAFRICENLATLTFPSSLTKIHDYAFENCYKLSGLLTIPATVNKVGNYAFRGCKEISGLSYFPSGNSTIGSYAFQGCLKLSGSLVFNNNITSIGSRAFNSCAKITSVTFGTGITVIETFTFSQCTQLTTITMSPNLVWIKQDAFRQTGLSGLLPLENVNKIDISAFEGCTALTDVNLSLAAYNAGNINANAFANCSPTFHYF